MGLDIYGHLVKKVRSSKEEPLKTISEYKKIADEQAKARFHEFAVASLKRLVISSRILRMDIIPRVLSISAR